MCMLQGVTSLQVEAVPVVTDASKGDDVSNTERTQIIRDGARRTRAVANAGDLVRGQTCFDRHLGQGWVDVEVAIEEEVADHEDGE